MAEFLILVHDDAQRPVNMAFWDDHITHLQDAGALKGGSSLGAASAVRDGGAPAPLESLAGFLILSAPSLEDARALLASNPDIQAGATAHIIAMVQDS